MDTIQFPEMHEANPEHAELLQWLKLNRASLEGRTPDEVAHLAVVCGFEVAIVCAVLSAFRDAMQGSSLDNRASFETWRFQMAVSDTQRIKEEQAKKELFDLTPYWAELAQNQQTGGNQ